jgi:pantoate kinase
VKKAKAFAPAGISSFFEICDTNENGKPIKDLTHVGARGGGFALQRGLWTEVFVSEAEKTNINVFINGKHAPEAETTLTVVKAIISKTAKTCKVTVNHKIEVPIGAGFGTSAGGALTAALALKEALDLPLTYNQIGKIAHIAEVQCKTGLGTVGPLMIGGCVLTLEPGAPGISVLDRLPLSSDCAVVAGVFGPTPTKQVLSSPEKRLEVNRYGRKTLEAILNDPSIENFLACCLEFAEKTGFVTPSIKQLVKLAQKAGAIGSAQNMLGQAVHSLVRQENADQVAEAFKQVLPSEKVIISKVDFQGARLIGHEKI